MNATISLHPKKFLLLGHFSLTNIISIWYYSKHGIRTGQRTTFCICPFLPFGYVRQIQTQSVAGSNCPLLEGNFGTPSWENRNNNNWNGNRCWPCSYFVQVKAYSSAVEDSKFLEIRFSKEVVPKTSRSQTISLERTFLVEQLLLNYHRTSNIRCTEAICAIPTWKVEKVEVE